MSAASPIARPANGVPQEPTISGLLGRMKLRAPSDLFIHQKIRGWIEFRHPPLGTIDQNSASKFITVSALLLHRLARAFERREAAPQRKPRKQLPPFSKLLQSTVKVTESVKKEIQFVGSDVMKALQVVSPSPTVAEVANACLGILSQNDYHCKELFRAFQEASGKDPSAFDEADAVFFGVFTVQALQALRAQAISTYEFAYDFEMIYRTCSRDDCFQKCMNALSPGSNSVEGAFATDTEARNICWKLARLLSLLEDCEAWYNCSTKFNRRNRILILAASIIITANIGKVVENVEVGGKALSAQKATIPEEEDFVGLVTTPANALLEFLTKNTDDDLPCISSIESRIKKVCKLITGLGIGGAMPGNLGSLTSGSVLSRSLLSKMLPTSEYHILLCNYRTVIATLEMHTQKKLGIGMTAKKSSGQETNVRTVMVDVLFFFPMAIGEPWGINRDAPMITTKILCLGANCKQPEYQKGSVAIVMEMDPKVRAKKRKMELKNPKVPDSTPTATKKTKKISFGEVQSMKRPKKVSHQSQNGKKETSVSTLLRTTMKKSRGESKTPFINDLSELNEWTLSILSVSIIKPTDTLLTYLGENDRTRGDGSSCLQDVIVPVLNRGALRIQNAIFSSSNFNSDTMLTTLSVGKKDGQVYVNGAVDNNVQLCASIIGLYYYSLEAMIQAQMERMDLLGSFGSQLQSRPFHRALLACCYSCVLKGVGMNKNLQMNGNGDMSIQSLTDCTETDPYTFLKVIEAFCRALIATKESNKLQNGSPIIAGLPVILHKYVQKLEGQLIDSVLWNTPVNAEVSGQKYFTLAIQTMKNLPGAWPPDILEPMLPEEMFDLDSEVSKSGGVRFKPSFGSSSEANFLSFVLRKLLKVAFFRIQAICATLNLSNEAALHTQILVAFRYLLRSHISVFNDRHVDQLLLCTIYGVCRVMNIQPKISFSEVIDAYLTIREEDQGERVCRIIIRHVKLASPGNESRTDQEAVGNIIVFYNSVYVPKMQNYFLGSKALKKAAALYKGSYKNEGRFKSNPISKTSSVVSVLDKQSGRTSDAMVVDAPPVATQTMQSTSSGRSKSGPTESSTKNIAQNSLPNKPEILPNGHETNQIIVDLTNGPTKAHSNTQAENGSKVSTTLGQNSSPAGAIDSNPKESTTDFSRDRSNPHSSTIANDTKEVALSTKHDENSKASDEVDHRKGNGEVEGSDGPNRAVSLEKILNGATKGGPQITGETNTINGTSNMSTSGSSS